MVSSYYYVFRSGALIVCKKSQNQLQTGELESPTRWSQKINVTEYAPTVRVSSLVARTAYHSSIILEYVTTDCHIGHAHTSNPRLTDSLFWFMLWLFFDSCFLSSCTLPVVGLASDQLDKNPNREYKDTFTQCCYYKLGFNNTYIFILWLISTHLQNRNLKNII
jgi:hypothetical protein